MNCYYCDKIAPTEPMYQVSLAEFDLGSTAPRCALHWRYICGQCEEPSHFMASAYCPVKGKFYCNDCATQSQEVEGAFWAWKYYYDHQSPWSGDWNVSLDRLEFEGSHPMPDGDGMSQETQLVRYREQGDEWNPLAYYERSRRPKEDISDSYVRANWNDNAEIWSERYDDDGDHNRRFQSDEPMLDMLGDVDGKRILDVGSGNGYLCRKLTESGASAVGVEISNEFLSIAMKRERDEPLGITYINGSGSAMGFLPDGHFDKAVSNYVLMDILDYEDSLEHVYRLLKPGGSFVVVISHPCFATGPASWVKPADDSPRREERYAHLVDLYFQRGPYIGQWGRLNPVLSFHRPIRDYWKAFKKIGFEIDDFEEPSVSERGLRELPRWVAEQAMRIPFSCIFRLIKPE